MTTGNMSSFVRFLRRVTLFGNPGGMTDGQLLDCFIDRNEELAFEALVRKHGPMVMGVCRRVLGNEHDAEDAFQATFLVLARKAASIVPRDMVGNWLYGVAHRTSLKAKAAAEKRRAKERQVEDMPGRDAGENEVWQDVQPLLDGELKRLPDKYRVAVVLCDLEGKTQQEAARQLSLPKGTLSSRLSRAHDILAKRLTRRGLALSAGTLALVLSQNAASASVPIPLVVATTKAACLFAAGTTAATGLISAKVAALTQGVIQAMFMTKIKIASVCLLTFGLLGMGAGVARHQVLAAKPEAAQQGLDNVLADKEPEGKKIKNTGNKSQPESNNEDEKGGKKEGDKPSKGKKEGDSKKEGEKPSKGKQEGDGKKGEKKGKKPSKGEKDEGDKDDGEKNEKEDGDQKKSDKDDGEKNNKDDGEKKNAGGKKTKKKK